MANLNFILVGRSQSGTEQAWLITSVHTGVEIGDIIWRPNWKLYCFLSNGQALDSSSLQEIAKFLDEQMGIRAATRPAIGG